MRRSEPESAASRDETTGARPRRERSARYPGVPLADAVDLARYVDDHGLDGLSAPDIASALGYRNIKTNTFSARLSSARQFGLLALKGDGYALTGLARSILHPVEPADLPRLYYQALLTPPLYSELAERLAQKRVPEAQILANVLYHNHQIIASAKLQAAEAFLESARFAGALRSDGIFRPPGTAEETPTTPPGPPTAAAPAPAPMPVAPAPAPPMPAVSSPVQPAASAEVRFDLRLWDDDLGKVIRLRAPESITPASFERFLQAFRLHVRIEDPPEPEPAPDFDPGDDEDDAPLDDPRDLP